MERHQFNVAPEITSVLGEARVDDVIARVQPAGECIVCHKTLGRGGKFALLADDTGSSVTVRVAHAPCFSSTRDDLTAFTQLGKHVGVVTVTDGTVLAVPAVYPILKDQMAPAVFTNPTVDHFVFIRDTKSGELLSADSAEGLKNTKRAGWASVADTVAAAKPGRTPRNIGGAGAVTHVNSGVQWVGVCNGKLTGLPGDYINLVWQERGFWVFALDRLHAEECDDVDMMMAEDAAGRVAVAWFPLAG